MSWRYNNTIMSNTTKITKHLENVASSFTVDPMGARLEELRFHNTLFLSSSVRGDGKVGSTHPCSPIFGPETNTSYGLPQHGPVRNMLFTVMDEDDHSVTLSGDIVHGAYPKGITFTQKLSLTPDVFTIKTAHTNHSKEHIPVNFGEHYYWNTPKGWNGVKVNGKDVTELVKTTGIVKLNIHNTVEIPGQPLVHLEQKGLHYAVLWSYKNPSSGKFDTNYVCIEPVEGNPMDSYFGSKPSQIEPHTERLTMLRISPD